MSTAPRTIVRRQLRSFQRKSGWRTARRFAGARVLIWSNEHSAWWRPFAAGYTTCKSEAGVYHLSDALASTLHCCAKKKIAFDVLAEAA